MNRATKRYGYRITIEKPLQSGNAYWQEITCWDEAEKDDCINLASIYDYKIISIRPFTWFDYRQTTNWKRDA